MNTMLAAASRYTDIGISVIPLGPDKSPAGHLLPRVDGQATWKPFQERLPSRDELERWFPTKDPAHIGLPCGQVSGNLLKIDFDVRRMFTAFRESVKALAPSLHEKLADAVLVETRKGVHLGFRLTKPPPGNQKLAHALLSIPTDAVAREKAGKPWVEFDGKEYPVTEKNGQRYALTVGIETRGEGGYVVAPPSPPYTLKRGDYADLPVLDGEEWETLVRIARSLTEHVPAATRIVQGQKIAAPSDGLRPGDDYNRRGDLVALLTDHGWSESRTLGETTYLTRPGKKCGVSASLNYGGTGLMYMFSTNAPPFDSNTAYSPFAVRALLECQGDYADCARALRAEGYGDNQQQMEIVSDMWDPILPLGSSSKPPFPTDILPPLVRDYVSATAYSIQVPVDLAGMLALGVASTLSAKVVEVQVKGSYSEPLNLFICAVMPPASRKSATFKAVVRPVMQLEAELQATERDEVRQYDDQKRILTGRRQEMLKRLEKAEDNDAQAELDGIDQQILGLVPKTQTRLWADDVTQESLTQLLAENDDRMAVLSAEGGVFDLIAGRYSGSPNLDVYLKGHAGDDLRVNRKGNGATGAEAYTISEPALTVAVTVQPQVLAGLNAKQVLTGRGLMARFLYAFPCDLAGQREVDTPDVPLTLVAAYHRLVRTMGRWRPALDADGRAVPHRVTLKGEARTLRNSWELEVDKRLASGGDLHGIAEWAGKLVGHTVRVAGLLHLLRYADEEAPWQRPIDERTMADAITFGRYAIPHARAAHQQMQADAQEAGAEKILGWIVTKERSEFAPRDVLRGLNFFNSIEDLKGPLNLLSDRGYVRQARPSTKARPLYQVNPAVAGTPSITRHCPQRPDLSEEAYAATLETEQSAKTGVQVGQSEFGHRESGENLWEAPPTQSLFHTKEVYIFGNLSPSEKPSPKSAAVLDWPSD